MADGLLEFGEANLIEIGLVMTTVASVFVSWVLAFFRAIGRGHGWWAVGVLFLWPLSYPYLLLKNGKKHR